MKNILAYLSSIFKASKPEVVKVESEIDNSISMDKHKLAMLKFLHGENNIMNKSYNDPLRKDYLKGFTIDFLNRCENFRDLGADWDIDKMSFKEKAELGEIAREVNQGLFNKQ